MIARLSRLLRPKAPLRVRFAHAEGRGPWLHATDKNVANLQYMVNAWNEMDGKETNWLEYER